MDTGPTDGEMIALSLSRPDVFVGVFERHYDAIETFLCRRVGPGLGEELASETFTRAFAGRARYDSAREDARPWLYGIAVNLIRRHWRKEARQLKAYARTGQDRVATAAPDPEDRRDVAAALAALRSEERDALLLLAWADLDYESIAYALGVPVGTVRSRVHRARVRMRSLLSAAPSLTSEEVTDG